MSVYQRIGKAQFVQRCYSSLAVNCKFSQPANHVEFKDPEWETAKPMSQIPGPSKLSLIKGFLPGGKYNGLEVSIVQKLLMDEFGPILRVPGLFGRRDIYLAYDPKDIQKVYRTEGQWPMRAGMDSFDHYRKKVRPDVFKNTGGLLTEHGKSWQDVRTVVNPVMMQPRNVLKYVEGIDNVSKDFVEILKQRVVNNDAPKDMFQELNKWALESIGYIALDTRLDVLGEGRKEFIEVVQDFFELTYKLDFLPSIWRLIPTPAFRKLIRTLDKMTELINGYINNALERMKTEEKSSDHELSVLEKLIKIDPNVAFVMAYDMLMAGVDTTSSAMTGMLYQLSKHPEKQNKLRAEIRTIYPDKNAPITKEQINKMPYLKACMKESQRVLAVAAGNLRTTMSEIVLQGYRIEKHTDVALAHGVITKLDTYFERADEFIPERWLKDPVEAGCPLAKTADPFIYMPFGFGPRACIGKRFADLEISVLTTRLLRDFELGWQGEDLKYVSRLVNIPADPVKFNYRILGE